MRERPVLPLVYLLLLHLVFYFWSGPVMFVTDDLAYATIAEAIRNGTFELQTHVFYNRFGATVVPALFYSWFGVNPYSTTAWSLICSLSLISAVYWTGVRIFGLLSGFVAALLVAVNPLHVVFAISIMTDGPLATFTFMSAAALYFGREAQQPQSQIGWGLGFSILFTLAFVSKCSVLWAFPFMVGLMLYDLKSRRHVRLWITISIAGTLLAVVYFGMYYMYTGEFLYRFSGVNKMLDQDQPMNAMQMREYFINRPLIDYIERLTYKPVLMFLSLPAIIVPMLFSWPAMIEPFRKARVLPASVRFWALMAWSILLFFWFGSNSSQYYTPYSLSDYYLLPLTPFLCFLAGVTIAQLVERSGAEAGMKRLLWSVIAVALVMLPVQKWLNFEKFAIVFTLAPLLGLVVLRWLASRLHWEKGVVAGVTIALIATLYPLNSALPIARKQIGESENLHAERVLVQKYLKNRSEPLTVVTDGRTLKALRYYLGFQVPETMQLINWSAEQPESAIHKRVLYFVNRNRLNAIQGTYQRAVPDFILKPPARWRLLEVDQGVSVYETDSANHG
ncbi:MAG: glycosyltransferase family 39 protein [Magnetococcales bacterium]|nr:glycosyltransferase family 39 protein [Magnetococcales bacterium]